MAVGIASAALATGAYAYTAANTVEASRAGDGNSTITGYDVTDVEYDLDTTNPAELATVRFTLDGEARTVKAKVDASENDYADCTETATADVWECALDTAVLDAGELTVIATE